MGFDKDSRHSGQVTQRAAGKEPSFLEDGDYLTMLRLMKEITQNYSLKMFAFCLMPNHVHLLFSPSEANLYDAMRDLFSIYAMRFNRKYERKGHLPARHREAQARRAGIETVRTGQFSNKPETQKAKKHLIEQLIARGYKRGEIAERLGISRKTVYNILKSQARKYIMFFTQTSLEHIWVKTDLRSFELH